MQFTFHDDLFMTVSGSMLPSRCFRVRITARLPVSALLENVAALPAGWEQIARVKFAPTIAIRSWATVNAT